MTRNWTGWTNESLPFVYDETAGEGTFAYVIEFGFDVDHPEFEDRASRGFDKAGPSQNMQHGTAVAGLIASKTFGVAKRASLIDVRLRRYAYGSTDDCEIIQALDWAVRDITWHGRLDKSVINHSMGGPRNKELNDAWDGAYDAGVLVIVAAGNENQNVDKYSPASEPSMITVGAVDEHNTRSEWKSWWGPEFSDYSNYGAGVDIWAPGSNVESVNYVGDGTSFAAPLVAGLALYLKSKEGLKTPKETTNRIFELSKKGVVKDTKDSPNRLAYLGDHSGPVRPRD
jgi:oryzin